MHKPGSSTRSLVRPRLTLRRQRAWRPSRATRRAKVRRVTKVVKDLMEALEVGVLELQVGLTGRISARRSLTAARAANSARTSTRTRGAGSGRSVPGSIGPSRRGSENVSIAARRSICRQRARHRVRRRSLLKPVRTPTLPQLALRNHRRDLHHQQLRQQ